jgi:hypothetical protein
LTVLRDLAHFSRMSQRTFLIVAAAITVMLVLYLTSKNRAVRPAPFLQARSHETYTTNFPLAENPVSEGGLWTNGKSVGVDWADVRTTPGLAFGAESSEVRYADSTALLRGNWAPDQMAQAIVHTTNQSDKIYEEVELRLRSTISAHLATGYEINFRCLKTENAYTQVVRWNGPLGKFTILKAAEGSRFGVIEGDVVTATIIGKVITAYINGTQVLQVTDGTYAGGNPGMGFYLEGSTGTNADFGFTQFVAAERPLAPSPWSASFMPRPSSPL